MRRAGESESGIRCLPRGSPTGRLIATSSDGREIAAQRFERVFLRVDFTARANAFATKKRDGWAPALDCVLKEKWQHDAGNGEEFLVHEQPQNRARERQRGGIRLQPSFNIPLLVQFVDAA